MSSEAFTLNKLNELKELLLNTNNFAEAYDFFEKLMLHIIGESEPAENEQMDRLLDTVAEYERYGASRPLTRMVPNLTVKSARFHHGAIIFGSGAVGVYFYFEEIDMGLLNLGPALIRLTTILAPKSNSIICRGGNA